eukprot:tig00020961_g16691.t1
MQKKKNFRRKDDGGAAEGADGAAAPAPSPPPPSAPKPEAKAGAGAAPKKPATLLSFAEEEGDAPQMNFKKKTSAVPDPVAHSKASKSEERRPAYGTQAAAGGQYTREALEALRKNAVHYKSNSDEARPPMHRGGMDVDGEQEEEEEEAVVRKAKQQREQARAKKKSSGEADYIPLTDRGRAKVEMMGDVVERGPGGRRVEADLSRVPPSPPAVAVPEEPAEEDEEDELVRWELQQIRKGVRRPIGRQQQQASPAGAAPAAQAGIAGLQLEGDGPAPQAAAPPPAGAGKATDPLFVYRGIEKAIENLKGHRERRSRQLTKAVDEMAEAGRACERLEAERAAAGERFTFFLETKLYMDDLLDCLSDKAPQIAELEERVLALRAERAQAAARRRQQDAQDELDDARDALGAPASGGGAGDEDTEPEDEAEAARAGGELASLLAEALAPPPAAPPACPASPRASLRLRRRGGQGLFGEVVEEFVDVALIKRRLEAWKIAHPKAYEEAYVSLTLPALFAPYVRLQLLQWDPLQRPAFDHMKWYKDLFDFGVSDSRPPRDGDPDLDLVPRLIEKAVLPVVRSALSKAWDPLSRTQNAAALALVRELQIYLDPSGEPLRELYEAVVGRLAAACEALPLPAFPFDEGDASLRAEPPATPHARAYRFCERQLALAIKASHHPFFLPPHPTPPPSRTPPRPRSIRPSFRASFHVLLRNVAGWSEGAVVTRESLEGSCVAPLLAGQVVPYLRAKKNSFAALFFLEKVVAALPASWLGAGGARVALRPLQEYAGQLLPLLAEARRGDPGGLGARMDRVAEALAVGPRRP